MQILKISLYGINGERRDVDFKPSQVNIITGASKKGKSSLIDIIEYCLGASECTVAEGYIRKTVSWYALLLQLSDVQVFIARAAPVSKYKSNSACHMLIEKSVIMPEAYELKKSDNINGVVEFLTRKIGIPEQVTEVPKEQTRSSFNIDFNHSIYYLFQGQDEVAAKRTLFHRQSEPYIPQTIKDTLPFFMGAADNTRFSEMAKLRNLRREKNKVIKRIQEIDSIKGEGLKKGFNLLAEASSIGIYKGEHTLSDDELLVELRRLNNWIPSNTENDDFDEEKLSKLQKQYDSLKELKRSLRYRINAAKEYAGSIHGYESELNEQSYRLQSIGIYKNFSTSSACPICEVEHENTNKVENLILSSIESLDNKLENISRNKPRINSYLESLKSEDVKLAEDIKKVRTSIDVLKNQELSIIKKEMLGDKRSRVVGRISLYLEGIEWSRDTIPLQNKLKILGDQIDELEKKLDPETLKEVLESQLSCVAVDMTNWARELKLEHCENPIRLDISKLTVVAETPNGRTPLYRMGSGENWVGYHLITYLALAKWFIKQKRPVCNFIVFDQPTQVYFPSDKAVLGKLEEIKKDEDRQAVKKMFKWIFKVVSELNPDLQVIITDHADIDEEWFQNAIVDKKWRGDNALIPKHWYSHLKNS
ncbi:DUF3732 domain-containing protein [Spartinivicinus poritis]|uniref:DUF3732 domain-containing protein n=1 Tax=Spartinivicinus poritis TaxID=2994640 RepID=A0ABT5U7S1_9GAMM|nr:DUF3732 domain-containing protein [Spartinivicinus sp. A2-2]MDE1462424.1 DUF3732 domain-containing protein [Spartinivicinus sp. A2-2]